MGTVSMDTPFKEAAVPNFLPCEIPPPFAMSLLFITHHQTRPPLPRCDQVEIIRATFHTSPGPSPQAKAPKRSSSSKFQCCDKDKSIYTLQDFKIRKIALSYSIFWWFAAEWHSLVRAWAGVLLFVVVYFTTSAWQISIQKPEDHYPKQNKNQKPFHGKDCGCT